MFHISFVNSFSEIRHYIRLLTKNKISNSINLIVAGNDSQLRLLTLPHMKREGSVIKR